MKMKNHVQPKRLFLLAFTQLWESFSYYGMRVLLVLYLTSQLQYQEGNAFALYALYTTLVELGSCVGGYIGDKLLGQRGAVVSGSILIGMGHLCLTFSEDVSFFFLGLGCIICGATLFRANLKAMVGKLYDLGDPRREAGFTLFYSGINLGGFAAALLCGLAAHHFGWHAGFGLAAIGMLIGLTVFLTYSWQEQTVPTCSPKLILSVGVALAACMMFGYLLNHYDLSQKILLPLACISFIGLLVLIGHKMQLKQAFSLSGILFLLIAYFSVEELMGSLLMIFSENQVDRMVLGYEIPSSVLNAVNPFVIISVGPLLAYLLNRYPIDLRLRLGLSFLCLSIGFLLLYLTSLNQETRILDLSLSFALIALGELFIAPSVFAYCSERAPAHLSGLMMGLVTTAFAIASLLSGQLSQIASQYEASTTLFLAIAVVSGVIFAGFAFHARLVYPVKGVT